LSEGSIEGCVVKGDEGGSDAELIVRFMSLWWRSDDGDRGEGGGRDWLRGRKWTGRSRGVVMHLLHMNHARGRRSALSEVLCRQLWVQLTVTTLPFLDRLRSSVTRRKWPDATFTIKVCVKVKEKEGRRGGDSEGKKHMG
jgi:hypothetical protein